MMSVIVLSTFWIPSTVKAEEKYSISEKLVGSLTAMGYEGIVLDKCKLEFSYSVVPTPENNGFNSYTRVLHLRHLSFGESKGIRHLIVSRRDLYSIIIPLDGRFSNLYMQAWDFREWARMALPDTKGIFGHPKHYDESIVSVESELVARVPDLKEMNRRVASTKFGEVTSVNSQFEINYPESIPLENFLHWLNLYVEDVECH